MNWARLLYNAAMLPIAAALSPFAYLIYRLLPDDQAAHWQQRLGFYPQQTSHHQHQRPLVWIHAVSVGEVGVAGALIDALDKVRPGLGIVVSTTTPHGQELAHKRLAQRASCIYFPLDILASVYLALRHIRPDVIICLETELWPNFLGEAQRLGISTLLLNGRISNGSFKKYRKIRSLTAGFLQNLSVLAMISKEDAARIIAMGAPAARVKVTGNMKGAGLLEQADPDRVEGLRRKLQLKPGQPVLVAGSIRSEEITWLPEVFFQLVRDRTDLVGIFAPRHLNRIGRLEAWFQREGIEFQHLSSLANGSEQRKTNVILVDTVGMLFDLYGVGDLIFCGGSLVPLGGQNIMEPAAWGKVVFYGPHMENFLEASQMLETAGCGIRVRDKDDLLEQLKNFLGNQKQLVTKGKRARVALNDRNQIAIKQAELVKEVLEGIEHRA